MLPYDKTNPEDIERYAQKLIGKRFFDILKEYFKENEIELEETLNKNKGKLGNLIEEFYFYYKPNSRSEADFPEANIELKVTPYLKTKDGKLKAKERLVIGMIPNNEPIEKDFEKSHILKKLQIILLILYFYDKKKDKLNYKIDYVKLFSILGKSCEKDLEVIKKDYKIIVDKIISGNAHKLSEGDTNYLGACTKGSSAEKSLQKQYYSDIPAKRRAFSLKKSYMSYVINNYIAENVATYETIMRENDKDITFEEKVLMLLDKNKNIIVEELCKKYDIESNSKQINNVLICRMLGVKTENIEEFEKANIKIKTIRVEKNGKVKESMSFPTIKIKEMIKENFENSYIFNYFSETKFLFVIFRKNNKDEYELKGSKIWNMPMSELENEVKIDWELYKNKFIEGINFQIKLDKNSKEIVKNDLPKKENTKVLHLRPRANKSKHIINGTEYGNGTIKDTDLLPNGDMIVKQCFWLNNSYIEKIIKDIIEGG